MPGILIRSVIVRDPPELTELTICIAGDGLADVSARWLGDAEGDGLGDVSARGLGDSVADKWFAHGPLLTLNCPRHVEGRVAVASMTALLRDWVVR